MKNAVIYNNYYDEVKAKSIFTIVIIVTIIIYIYYIKRNYDSCKIDSNIINNTRLIGSIFILIGVLCFLYYQINSSYITSPEI